jgi:hypothetical protein
MLSVSIQPSWVPTPLSIRFLVRQAREVRRPGSERPWLGASLARSVPGSERPWLGASLARSVPGSESTKLHAGSVRANLPGCAVEVSCLAEDHVCLGTGSVLAAHEFMLRLNLLCAQAPARELR